MDKYYRDFKYKDKYVSDFGMIAIKSDNENENGLSRELVKSSFSTHKRTLSVRGAKYKEPMKLKFLILKNPCISMDHMYMTREEVEYITEWLTSANKPEKLYLDSNIEEYYVGMFTDVETRFADDIYGINITFECTSPYSFTHHKRTFLSENSATLYCQTINNTSETEDYVYPIITIKGSIDKTINIIGNNCNMILNLQKTYSEVVIDNKNKMVFGDGKALTFEEFGWNLDDMLNWNMINSNNKRGWIKLSRGSNNFTFTIPTASGKGYKVEIEYDTPKKSGGV